MTLGYLCHFPIIMGEGADGTMPQRLFLFRPVKGGGSPSETFGFTCY